MHPQPSRFRLRRQAMARSQIEQDVGGLPDHEFSGLEKRRRERRRAASAPPSSASSRPCRARCARHRCNRHRPPPARGGHIRRGPECPASNRVRSACEGALVLQPQPRLEHWFAPSIRGRLRSCNPACRTGRGTARSRKPGSRPALVCPPKSASGNWPTSTFRQHADTFSELLSWRQGISQHSRSPPLMWKAICTVALLVFVARSSPGPSSQSSPSFSGNGGLLR